MSMLQIKQPKLSKLLVETKKNEETKNKKICHVN